MSGEHVVTPERFAQGKTFEEYVAYVGSAENLVREAGWWLGPKRHNLSHVLRAWYERARLDDAQIAAIRYLAAQHDGPAKLLVISEEWSSDCRRDVPMLARLAEVGDLELRIFQRDGQKCSRAPRADPAESPNADIVNAFLNEKNGQTFQSVPVAVFLTKQFEPLYRYVEFPAIYPKMRLAAAMQVAKPGESREQPWARCSSRRSSRWASAAVDEMISALHERLVVGPRPVS